MEPDVGDLFVHGLDGRAAPPDWRPLEARELRWVLSAYGIEGEPEVRWRSPRPFSAAALVGAGGERFFVKRHHRRVRTPEGLAPEHDFARHLGRNGVTVPELVETPGGERAVARGEWTYEVQLPGRGEDLYRDAFSWTPFRRPEHAVAAGRALAHLHLAAEGFEAPARPPGVLVAQWVTGEPDLLGALAGLVARRPALAEVLAGRPWRDQLAPLALPHHRELAAVAPSLAPCWTHNDWHASNLLWSAGTVSSVFDFGLANRTTAVYDLATAVERHAVGWLATDPGSGNPGSGHPSSGHPSSGHPGHPCHPTDARALLDGYRAVRRLDDAEVAALPALLPIVHLEQALSELEYFGDVVGSAGAVERAYEDYLLGHAAWFGSPSGRVFLGELRRALDGPAVGVGR